MHDEFSAMPENKTRTQGGGQGGLWCEKVRSIVGGRGRKAKREE